MKKSTKRTDLNGNGLNLGSLLSSKQKIWDYREAHATEGNIQEWASDEIIKINTMIEEEFGIVAFGRPSDQLKAKSR